MSPSAARCRTSRTFAKISSPAGTGGRIVELGDPSEPQRGLLELRHRGKGVRGTPYPGERRLVGELGHLCAEGLPQTVLLHLHLEPEELLQRAVGGAALSVTPDRFVDRGERLAH